MHYLRRISLTAALFALQPWLCGFVLLGAREMKLPVTPEAPIASFVWDGKAPKEIQEKEKYKGGIYAGLDDTAMMQQLLTDAMGLWNNVPGSFVKLEFSQGSAVDDMKDKQNSIMVLADKNLSSAAFAKPTPDPDDPNIISDCDVHINDTAGTADDIAYTIAHELGHCLGLGHAHTNYDAMMGYSRGPRTMTLGPDDRAGIIYLYPDPAVWDGKSKELVCGTVGTFAGESKKPAMCILICLLVLPLAAALWPREKLSPAAATKAPKQRPGTR